MGFPSRMPDRIMEANVEKDRRRSATAKGLDLSRAIWPRCACQLFLVTGSRPAV